MPDASSADVPIKLCQHGLIKMPIKAKEIISEHVQCTQGRLISTLLGLAH
jgi:hypothetical protein